MKNLRLHVRTWKDHPGDLKAWVYRFTAHAYVKHDAGVRIHLGTLRVDIGAAWTNPTGEY